MIKLEEFSELKESGWWNLVFSSLGKDKEGLTILVGSTRLSWLFMETVVIHGYCERVSMHADWSRSDKQGIFLFAASSIPTLPSPTP